MTIFIKTLVFAILLNLAFKNFAQGVNVESKKDWQNVELRILISEVPPDGFKLKGEWAVKGLKDVGSLEKLKEKSIMQIKKKAAENQASIVYVDIDGLLNFPDGLYYFFGNDSK